MAVARVAIALAAAGIALSACGGGGGSTGTNSVTTSPTVSPTVSPTTTPSTTPPTPTPTGSPSPSEDLPEVTSTVIGTAVAGNSGETSPSLADNRTERLSEVVRLDNGHCIGWDGGTGGSWTQGLEDGAKITVFDASTGRVIGSGVFEDSSWADVDPGDKEQWTCTFPFTVKITTKHGVPKSFKIKVGSLAPWTAHLDPTHAGRFVTSVSTVADPASVPDCSGGLPDVVSLWSPVVGLYWSNGFAQLCSSGIKIAKVERPCRSKTVGSDYIVAVLSAVDRKVYEDASGLQIGETDLPPSPSVVVQVATGQPCG